MEPDNNLIYGLKDPISKEIRYVGKTTVGFKRINSHFRDSKEIKKKTHKACWIRSLLSKNLEPEVVILEKSNDFNTLNQKETYWITKFKNLTNHTLGGEGIVGYKHSSETIKKISFASKRNRPKGSFKMSEESKKKCSESGKKRFLSKLARIEHSKALGGKPFKVWDLNGNFVGKWTCRTECANILNVSRSNLITHLNNPNSRKRVGKYVAKLEV